MSIHVKLDPQEQQSTHAKFDGQVYATQGFKTKFGPDAPAIALKTMIRIGERVASKAGADYFQTAEFNGERFYIIDDIDHITFLLPQEY